MSTSSPYRWATPIPDPRATSTRRLRRLRRLVLARTREAALFGALALLAMWTAAKVPGVVAEMRRLTTVVEPDASAHRFPDAEDLEDRARLRIERALLEGTEPIGFVIDTSILESSRTDRLEWRRNGKVVCSCE